ncbi:hypothetical protein RJ55_02838 [Drechmeria coniospora]|nr:hypothetical protein RJ55_02838 [Drechmeria coniospora]
MGRPQSPRPACVALEGNHTRRLPRNLARVRASIDQIPGVSSACRDVSFGLGRSKVRRLAAIGGGAENSQNARQWHEPRWPGVCRGATSGSNGTTWLEAPCGEADPMSTRPSAPFPRPRSTSYRHEHTRALVHAVVLAWYRARRTWCLPPLEREWPWSGGGGKDRAALFSLVGCARCRDAAGGGAAAEEEV